jgi:hypothetical protein
VLTLTITLVFTVREVSIFCGTDGEDRKIDCEFGADGEPKRTKLHKTNKRALHPLSPLLTFQTIMKLFTSITLLAACGMLDMAAAFAPTPAFGVSRYVAQPTATFLVLGKSPVATTRSL